MNNDHTISTLRWDLHLIYQIPSTIIDRLGHYYIKLI